LEWLGRLDLPARWGRWIPPWLTGVLVGTALCALSVGIRTVLQMVWPTVVPFGFLFPMILLATLIGRLLGGLTTFALGGLVIWYIIRPDLQSAGLGGFESYAILILYLIAGGTMLLIAEAYRRAQDALHREQTLRAEAETERQRLLAQELSHRIKNMLATVQAIAAQTLDGAGVDSKARRAFQDRLIALASAHDLLTEANWTAVPLDQLVTGATAAFDNGGRIKIDGPALPLSPRQAIALSLALHELATNALKYGALSSNAGEVDIAWQQDGEAFRLGWSERGGPPVTPPQRTGFGTRMLQRNLAAELRGTVNLDYAPEGLRCEILAGTGASSPARG